MPSCVFCNSLSNLNTEMSITVDDNKISVHICDEHADDATVKTARDAYMRKQEEIQKVLEQAKALGLNISTTGSGLVIAESPRQQPQQPQRVQQIQQIKKSISDDFENDPDVVPTTKLDSHRGMSSVGGGTEFGMVESINSFDMGNLRDKLPEEARQGVAKMTVVEGRQGQPLMIPKKRRDGTGTTVINIIKTDDQSLQESFKRMAGDSMQDNVPNFARAGYRNTTKDCPLCYGNCEMQGRECPKCKGTGVISLY